MVPNGWSMDALFVGVVRIKYTYIFSKLSIELVKNSLLLKIDSKNPLPPKKSFFLDKLINKKFFYFGIVGTFG